MWAIRFQNGSFLKNLGNKTPKLSIFLKKNQVLRSHDCPFSEISCSLIPNSPVSKNVDIQIPKLQLSRKLYSEAFKL